MAVISNTRMNIVEWSQFLHRGKVLPQVEMLAQENQSVMDVPFSMCNDGTTHLYSVQTALPTVSKTAFNEGSAPSKSQKAQEREICTMLTGFSQIDADLAEVGGQEGALRAKEDASFAEALKQAFAQMQFYGNRASDIKDINGFATRYNHTTGTKAKNVLSCGGTTASVQTSIYLVNWGADVYGIFPEGTTAGYAKQDLGRQTITLASGNLLVVKQTKHKWHVGLVVEDWRSVVRICNIEVTDANALTNAQAPTSFTNVLHQMTRARLRIRKPGKKVFYCNDTVFALMMRLGLEKSANGFTVQQAVTQFGTFMELSYLGTPIRRVDQILNTEEVVPV